MAILNVPDEVVITFFAAVVGGLVGAVGILWKHMLACIEDRKALWRAMHTKKDKQDYEQAPKTHVASKENQCP